MQQYLCFQRHRRGNGRRYTTPVIKTMTRRYGAVTGVEVLSRKRSVLITGAHDSGKSRWLRRLYAEADDIWGRKTAHKPLYLSAMRPLAAWAEQPQIVDWWAARAQRLADNGQAMQPWDKLRAWERIDALPEYLRDTGAVLFLDDCHKLTGRKLQVARDCVLAARVYCATAADEVRIAPNLRAVMMRTDPQIVRLTSEVAYDATAALVWILALAAVAAGAWEIGAVLAGLRALASGRRASKQDA